MADFSVGNYSDLIDNLNPQIAAGPPKIDFSQIASLPDTYYRGQENRFKQDLRGAFKDGIPTGPDGSPDYGAMAKKLYQLGDVTGANNLANIDISRQQLRLGQEVSAGLGGMENGGNPPLSVPQVAPGANGAVPPSPSNNMPRGIRNNNPGNLTVSPFTTSQAGYAGNDGRFAQFSTPQAGTAAADNLIQSYGQRGIATPLAIASRWAPRGDGANDPSSYGGYIAKQLGVDVNTPLNLSDPTVRQKVVQAISQFENGGQTSVQPGAPAPVPAQPQTAQPQQTAVSQPTAPQGVYPPTAPNRGSFPTGADPEIQKQIARLTQISSNPALPQPVRDTAKARLEFIQKQAESTNEQKNYDLARRQGYQGSFEQFQSDQKMATSRAGKQGEQFAAQYQQVQELGQKAFQELPQLEAVQKLMNDPNFYSGIGEKYNLFFKRALAALGGDPNSAVPQEAFRKVVSGSILNSLGMLKGLGQIRVAEINLAKEASASSDNTPGGNRMLIEIAKRTYQHSQDVADLARNYNGGNLDAGFDRVVTQYNRQHPLFNDAELKNPKLLTYPQFNSPQEVMRAKLPKGSPFRVQGTDDVRTVP